MDVQVHPTQGAARQDRRGDVGRRAVERRDASRASVDHTVDHTVDGRHVERRASERRRVGRRTSDVPSLLCPDCLGPLQYEADLSWNLPGAYTVDSGFCPSCARRFLRNRETGDYDALSW